MRRLFRNCIYQGKYTCRDSGFLFWTLIYPMLMAIFFYTAFGGLLDVGIEDIKVGVSAENPIIPILEEIDFLNLEEIPAAKVDENLDTENIHVFIDNDLNIRVKKSGLEETIVKEIVDQIIQMKKLNRPIENYDFTKDYVSAKNQKADSIVISFYSLIAMVSTYGVFAGMEVVMALQANLSNIGARISMTPLRKESFLFSGIIVSLVLNLLANGILLTFTKFVLNMDLFRERKYSVILIIMGNLFGVALGIFIGASNRKSSNVKNVIGIVVTLVMSFLSGMMGPWVKTLLDRHIPIVGRLNPIGIITNGLYRVNLLGSTRGIGEGILFLGIYSLILIAISYVFLRRQSYDSV